MKSSFSDLFPTSLLPIRLELLERRRKELMSKHGDDWEHELMDWVDMVNKTNNKTRKWIDGKLEVVCPACKAIAEHKVFTTFDYWYCNTCKAEVKCGY